MIVTEGGKRLIDGSSRQWRALRAGRRDDSGALSALPPAPVQHVVRDEGIVLAFLAESGHRPVARNERDVVPERPELLRDRRDQRRMVAAGEIGAADRALEQHVADDREAAGAGGRTPRGPACGRACGSPAASARRSSRCRRPRASGRARTARASGSRSACPVAASCSIQNLSSTLRPFERNASASTQFGRAAAVVDVAVREQHLLEHHAGLGERLRRCRSRSPPGSKAAARLVSSQISSEQFCAKGVTGTIASFIWSARFSAGRESGPAPGPSHR